MLRKLLVSAVAAGAVLVFAGQALADTTIGQTVSGIGTCTQAALVPSSGTAYVVPSGTWKLTSWSTQAGATGGQMSLMVFRSTGGGSYTVVGESPVESLTANTLNTFTLGTPITVEAGDLLGMWESGAYCVGSSANTVSYTVAIGEPSVGATFTPAFTNSYALNISATLTAAVSPLQVDSMFVCYSKWEQDGGAVFPISQAEELLAEGWWLPTAVPGTVEGGDNLGDYHLECNPQSGLTASGKYVDDGGEVLDADAGLGSYAIKS